MPEELTYRELTESDVSTELVSDINQLLPQLTPNAVPCTVEKLEKLFESGTRVFAAMDGDTVIGTVLLCPMVILVGQKDWIEDVIVDENYRGRGIAGHLMDMAEQASQTGGAKSINLTSKPDRGSARSVYEARGYAVRETDVFRLTY